MVDATWANLMSDELQLCAFSAIDQKKVLILVDQL